MEKKESSNLFEIIIVIIFLLGAWYYISPNSFLNTFSFLNKDKKIVEKSRTILVYMSPSNIESVYGLASNDLNSIDKEKFDFEHNQLIVMAGGSNSWRNNLKKYPTIYKYNKMGDYEEIDDGGGHTNMGDAATLSYFLNYVSDNYKSDEYIVYLYGHGNGIDGLLPDEVSNDGLSLSEMNRAFNNSLIDFDLFISNSCLMGTIETLDILSNHAKYAITTEEVGWSTRSMPMFAMFNKLDSTKDLETFSKEYIDYYKESVKDITDYATMSLVDLEEIPSLYSEVHNLFGSIDVDKFYEPIKTYRSGLTQISNDDILDEVDLQRAMSQFFNFDYDGSEKRYSKQIKKTVIYSYSNTANLTGISIWFPYYDSKVKGDYFVGNEYLYKEGTGYRNFISKFIKKQKEEYGI